MDIDENKGIIAWFVNNHVAANLLVVLILLGGIVTWISMQRELLPTPESKKIYISANYLTASPKEVEEGITVKIEDVVKNSHGIKRVQSSSTIGYSSVTIDIEQDADIDLLMQEIKASLDSVSTFPTEMEALTIRKAKPLDLAIQLQLYGKLEEGQAKDLAESIKRDMLANTMIKRIDILGTRKYEISIEVSEEQLQKYKMTLRQVANKIRAESVTGPLGAVTTKAENILIKVSGQGYRQQDFENIPLLTTEMGTVVRVRDVAVVKDAYIDFDQKGYFDDQYSVGLTVFAVGDQDVIKVADAAKAYVAKKQASLPDGVKLTPWLDISYYVDSRLYTMGSNLFYGGLMVFLLLALFMDFKIALWVIAGIPVSMAGAFILMTIGNVTLNMVSMFGFIMIVGIVIDDSIIVAESVDEEVKKYGLSKASIIRGTKKVATPAVFGILTSIVAFLPMLFVGGLKHVYLYSVGYVVIACLIFALMESKWVLPSHLMSLNQGWLSKLHSRRQHALQVWMNKKLEEWVFNTFIPWVKIAVEHRYTTLAVFFSMLVLTMAAVAGGVIKYELFPAEANDFVTATFSVAQGISNDEAKKVQSKIEHALYAMEEDYQHEFKTENKLINHVFSYGSGLGNGALALELTKSENRQINSFEIAERWQKKVGDIEGAKITVSGAKTEGSRNLSFLLLGADEKELNAAALDLLEQVKKINGVSNASQSIEKSRQEYVLKLKPQANSLNITLADLALQVRDAFYGTEVQRIQRDREEVIVYVRYPKDKRSSIVDLESMHIRVPDGRFLQLKELADIDVVMAESNIVRINGENAAYVTATIDREVKDPGKISKTIIDERLPKLFAHYPGVRYKADGVSYDEKEVENEVSRYTIIVLFVIYILLAIPLKSYTQPLIIMSAIPFGLVGAAWGHWIFGYSISVMSLFGLIALSGIIVNDTLVLIDFVNTSVNEEGQDVKTASINASGLRFRAIMLTTVTTFVGDLPIILETSIEAANMIPMAISLGVGMIFATAIILVMAPCMYVVLEDIKGLFNKKPAELTDT